MLQGPALSECVAVCPESAPFMDGSNCVSACPSGYFEHSAGKCVAVPTNFTEVRLVPEPVTGSYGVVGGENCPLGFYSIAAVGKTLCVESCAAYGLVIDDIKCAAACSNASNVL